MLLKIPPRPQLLIPKWSQVQTMEKGWTWHFHLHSIRKKVWRRFKRSLRYIHKKKRQRIKQRKTGVLTGSWHVRTLFRIGSILMFTHQLIWYNVEMSAIQETRLQRQHIIETKARTFFVVGKRRENNEYGVAFVVKREVINHVIDFKTTSERKCSIGIKTTLGRLCILTLRLLMSYIYIYIYIYIWSTYS